MLELLISTARLAHIKRIFPILRHARWIIAIIINHPPEDGVSVHTHVSIQLSIRASTSFHLPHSFVHVICNFISGADVEIHKPGVVVVGSSLKLLSQPAGKSETAPGWGDGQDCDVSVPWCVMLGVAHCRVLLFELAHD